MRAFVSHGGLGLAPRANHRSTSDVASLLDGVGDQLAKQRQLETPALHVLVARLDVGELVRQLQQRSFRMAIEPNRDARAISGYRLAARVAIREHDSFWRLDLQHLTGRPRRHWDAG